MATTKTPFLITLMTGLVFLSEGIQKFLFPAEVGAGRFARIGVPYPDITGYIIGSIEIIGGLLLILRWQVKWAAIPLTGVILGAIGFTKIPSLWEKGFWTTAHEGRTDFLMIMSLLFILITEWRKR